VEAPDIGHSAGKMFSHPNSREAVFGKGEYHEAN
jgi:hypothetical protein